MGSCNIFGLLTLKLKGSGIVICLIGLFGVFAPDTRPNSGLIVFFSSSCSPVPSFSLLVKPQVALS